MYFLWHGSRVRVSPVMFMESSTLHVFAVGILFCLSNLELRTRMRETSKRMAQALQVL